MNKIAVYENEKFEVREVEDISLEYQKSIVGGWIELAYIDYLNSKGIDMFCNEEGKLFGLKPSIYLLDGEDNIYDVICGNVYFVSHDDDGNTIGLTDEQVEVVKDIFTSGRCIVAKYGMLPYIQYYGSYDSGKSYCF